MGRRPKHNNYTGAASGSTNVVRGVGVDVEANDDLQNKKKHRDHYHHHHHHHRKTNCQSSQSDYYVFDTDSSTGSHSRSGSRSRRSWFSTVATEASSMSVPSDLSSDEDEDEELYNNDYDTAAYGDRDRDGETVSPASSHTTSSIGRGKGGAGAVAVAGEGASDSYRKEDHHRLSTKKKTTTTARNQNQIHRPGGDNSDNRNKPTTTASSSSLPPSFFSSSSSSSAATRDDGLPTTTRSRYFSQRLVGLLSILALVQPLLLFVNTDQIFFFTNTSRRAMTIDQNNPPPPYQQLQQQQHGGSGGGTSSTFVQNLPALRLGGIVIGGNNNSSSSIASNDNANTGAELDGKKPDIIVPWPSILHEVSTTTSSNGTVVTTPTTTTASTSQRRVVQPPRFDTVTTNPALNASDDYPDDQGRVLFLISMGQNARKSKIVERFVYSARTRGRYQDWIVILSDAPKKRYKEIRAWTDKLIHIRPDPKHLNPAKHNFTLTSMGYKRLKTYVLEYVATDRRLDDVQLVYYLDVDIVFGDSVWPMFHGLESTYGISEGTSPITSTDKFHGQQPPDGRMWMFHGNTPKWKLQGGQMFLHRQHSQPCLERWRYLIDSWSRYARKDQDMLMRMLQDQTNAIDNEDLSSLECEVVIMKQKPFIEFPDPKAIVRRARDLRKNAEESNSTTTNSTGVVTQKHHYYSPLVHLRNDGGTKRIAPGNIKVYIQDVLQFEEGQKDKLGVLKKMAM
mmetsp:Transcript_31561/g.76496  ORF Transcript_31561/g.76496 Transcript_31561/m.76496 type:complete len:734 (+) Transcript_31561:227-2428(+)